MTDSPAGQPVAIQPDDDRLEPERDEERETEQGEDLSGDDDDPGRSQGTRDAERRGEADEERGLPVKRATGPAEPRLR